MLQELYDYVIKFFQFSGFPARWMCGDWSDFHGWLYIISNIVIWAAYFTIPIILLYFVYKRKDLPFKKLIILFTLFILFCGLTHLVDAVIFWYPIYRVNAFLLFGTAIVSFFTALTLKKEMPSLMTYKSPEELEKIIEIRTKELLKINKELELSKTEFRALVDYIPDVIVKLDKDIKNTFVNKALIKETHFDIDNFIGKTPFELDYRNADINGYVNNIKKVFETKKTIIYDREFKDGNVTKYYKVSIIPLISDEDEINEVMVIAKNITKEKNAEKELKESLENLQNISKGLIVKNKQLENYAYIISHNIRSPIGNLISLLNLYDEEEDTETKETIIDNFKKCTEIISKTIGHLFEVVQIRQNLESEQKLLNFEGILKDLMTSISIQIFETKAKITYDFSQCPEIVYSKIYLESILLNLLTNAIKYRSYDRLPEIHFETKKEDDFIILTCQDNGIGIDLEKNGHKLFGLYKTFNRNSDAKGVGLFLTKNQIEALGGTITADSEVGKGTIFTIQFNSF